MEPWTRGRIETGVHKVEAGWRGGCRTLTLDLQLVMVGCPVPCCCYSMPRETRRRRDDLRTPAHVLTLPCALLCCPAEQGEP